jgi:hypothetical protein
MANQAQIQRTVEMFFDVYARDSLREIERLVDAMEQLGVVSRRDTESMNMLRTSLSNMGASTRNIDGAFNNLNATTAKGATGFKAYHQSVTLLDKAFGAVSGSAKMATGVLSTLGTIAGAADTIGFGAGLKTINDYNKALLSGSATWSKYGTGIGQFERSMKSMSNTTHLTQQETLSLLSSYQKGFNFPSLKGAESLFMNLRKAVGSNKDAMQEMMGVLSSITEKFPDLEQGITRLNSSDKQRLSLINQQNVMLGEVSLSQGKQFQDYLNGNSQMSEADKKHKEEVTAQIDAMQDIKKVLEEIAQQIGKQLMPMFMEVSRWLKESKNTLLSWVPAVMAVASAFTGLLVTLSGIANIMRIFKGAKDLFGWGKGAADLAKNVGSGAADAGGGAAADAGGALVADAGAGAAADVAGTGAVGAVGTGAAATGTGLLATTAVAAIPLAIAAGVDHYVGGHFRDKAQSEGEAAKKAADSGDVASFREHKDKERHAEQAGAVTSVGSYALGGAAAGALVGGPIGAAIGAVGGAIVGWAMHAHEINQAATDTLKNWLGISQSSKIQHEESTEAFSEAAKASENIKDEMQKASSVGAKFGTQTEQEGGKSADSALAVGDEVTKKVVNTRELNDQSFDDVSKKSTIKSALAKQEKAFADAESQQDKIIDEASKSGDAFAQAVAEAKKSVLEANKEYNDARQQGGASDSEMKDLADNKKAAGEQLAQANADRSKGVGGSRGALDNQYAQSDQDENQKKAYASYAAALSNKLAQGGSYDAMNQFQQDQNALKGISTQKVDTSDSFGFAADAPDVKATIEQFGGANAKDITSGKVAVGQEGQVGDVKSNLDDKLKQAQGQMDKASAAGDSGKYEQAQADVLRIKKAINATDDIGSKIEEKKKEVVGDVATRNGYILAALSSQRVVLEAQNKLYDSQVGVVDSIIQVMSQSGDVDQNVILSALAKGQQALEQQTQNLQSTIDTAKQTDKTIRASSAGDNKEAFALAGVDETKYINLEIDPKVLAAQSQMLNQKAQDAYQGGDKATGDKLSKGAQALSQAQASDIARQTDINKLEAQRNNLKTQQLDLVLKAKDAYAGELELTQSETDYQQSQVDLVDSMGVGLKASVGARMEVVSALQKEQGVLAQQLATQQAALKTLPQGTQQWAKAQASVLKIQTQQTQNLKKQADITKVLRDGYVSAITAMNFGSGLFSKVMITQDKNLGFAVKNLRVLQSKSSGGIGGGMKQTAGQFTADGMTYNNENQQGYKTETPGGNYSNRNPNGPLTQGAAAAEIAKTMANTPYTAAANAVGASGNIMGATMQAGMNGQPSQIGQPMQMGQPAAAPDNSAAIKVAEEDKDINEQQLDTLNNILKVIQGGGTPPIKHARGGMVHGPSHAHGGVSFMVGNKLHELEGGEAVINKKAAKKHAGILSAINESTGGKKFATGGFIGSGNMPGHSEDDSMIPSDSDFVQGGRGHKYSDYDAHDRGAMRKWFDPSRKANQDTYDKSHDPAGFARRQKEAATHKQMKEQRAKTQVDVDAEDARRELLNNGLGDFSGKSNEDSMKGLNAARAKYQQHENEKVNDGQGHMVSRKDLNRTDEQKHDDQNSSYSNMFAGSQDVSFAAMGLQQPTIVAGMPGGAPVPPPAATTAATPPPPKKDDLPLPTVMPKAAVVAPVVPAAPTVDEKVVLQTLIDKLTHEKARKMIIHQGVLDNLNAIKQAKDNEGWGDWFARKVAPVSLNADNNDQRKIDADYSTDGLADKKKQTLADLNDTGMQLQKAQDQLKALQDAGAKHRFGGIIPKFAAGGIVPDMGMSQNPLKSMLGSMMPSGRLGDHTIAAFNPGSEIVRNKDVMTTLQSAKTSRDIPTSNAPIKSKSNDGGGKTASVSIDNVTVKVEMGNLGSLGGIVKREIDKAMENVAKTIRGGRDSTIPANA